MCTLTSNADEPQSLSSNADAAVFSDSAARCEIHVNPGWPRRGVVRGSAIASSRLNLRVVCHCIGVLGDCIGVFSDAVSSLSQTAIFNNPQRRALRARSGHAVAHTPKFSSTQNTGTRVMACGRNPTVFTATTTLSNDVANTRNFCKPHDDGSPLCSYPRRITLW